VASACLAQWRGGSWAAVELKGSATQAHAAGPQTRAAKVLQRRPLEGWELEPGTRASTTTTGDACLLAPAALLPIGVAGRSRKLPRPGALIDAPAWSFTLLGKPVRQVRWHGAG